MIKHGLIAAAAFSIVLAIPVSSIAQSEIPSTDVTFPRGATGTSIRGTIQGDQTRDYVVRARAGQEMQVDLSGSDIIFFNVLPPGSDDEAIFIGSNEGNSFGGTLGISGAYKIRVYQMRATARRGETGNFTLTLSVTGGSGSGGSQTGGLSGLSGTDSIAAIDTMTERGFANVDTLESGETQYGIFYNRRSRVCAQLTMADGRVVDARDIQTHPKCR